MASVCARRSFEGRDGAPVKVIEAASSTPIITDCAACHSVWRTKCPSDRAERRQSMDRSASPASAGRYCQNSSPVPARFRPCVPRRTVAARCCASAISAGSDPARDSERDLRLSGV
jgi:hypothetical protein